MLELKNVQTYYGNIQALKGISFSVNPGEIVCLIGSNGAGKTTTLRTIQGLIRPRAGTITFEGKDLVSMSSDQIVLNGVSQSPEGRLVFSRMTVKENLEMGAYSRKDRANIKQDVDRVFGLWPRLQERASQKAGTLSGGEQQMLAMGRALMARPRLLLLDEPSMGLAPMLVEQIFRTIIDINGQGTTVLLVEQNAAMALSIADRGYVIQTGRILLEDSGQNLLRSEMVRKAYLGEE
ncbi:MAG: ABC transporter ATP-binding protein [Anaerolineae bacterium]